MHPKNCPENISPTPLLSLQWYTSTYIQTGEIELGALGLVGSPGRTPCVGKVVKQIVDGLSTRSFAVADILNEWVAGVHKSHYRFKTCMLGRIRASMTRDRKRCREKVKEERAESERNAQMGLKIKTRGKKNQGQLIHCCSHISCQSHTGHVGCHSDRTIPWQTEA